MSTKRKPVSVFAPASIGNLTVGFDILGLAIKSKSLSLGDTVRINESEENTFTISGNFSKVLPSVETDNLVIQARDAFREIIKESSNTPIAIELQKDLPICSGLGSSACSVVAAIAALNEYYGRPLNSEQALALMGKIEAQASGSIHYDNIAPSFLGGLQLCSANSEQTYALPWPQDWRLVMAYPDIDIPTEHARNILPSEYSSKIVIQQTQCVAQFVHALHTDNVGLAKVSIQDYLAEPYRQSLLPNFNLHKKHILEKHAAVSVGISGSGPTVFVITDQASEVENIKDYLYQNYVLDLNDGEFQKGFVVEAEICKEGVSIL